MIGYLRFLGKHAEHPILPQCLLKEKNQKSFKTNIQQNMRKRERMVMYLQWCFRILTLNLIEQS